GGTTYQWVPSTGLSNANIANPVASPLLTTTYTVVVSNNNCTATASVTVTVIPKPTVNAGIDQTILSGNTIQLKPTITGSNLQYKWLPATYLDDPTIPNPIASPTQDITYTLYVTSQQGCFTVSDDIAIKVNANITPTNTITPNGDGINDVWNIPGLSTYPSCVVNIYNRYGKLLFTSLGYAKAWDGKYNNAVVPSGTYYYTIDLKNGSKVISGWIAVVK
ncbi:MAG: gliding motility-associated C-terminal domain-containing protein, partial [Mucilaginibacter sp.]